MIVLSVCSINSYANSSTGEQDSVYIAYDDLRIVNSKLIELEYEKLINDKLRSIMKNDSEIINLYKIDNKQLKHDRDKFRKQRNVCCIILAISVIIIIF